MASACCPQILSEERSSLRRHKCYYLSRLRIFSRTGAPSLFEKYCARAWLLIALRIHHCFLPSPPSLQGYTTWPEDWNTAQENLSKMHGCYNGIGLWFIEGLAGIVVDASAQPPLSFRAAVEVADITWASGSRYVCGVRVVLNDVEKRLPLTFPLKVCFGWPSQQLVECECIRLRAQHHRALSQCAAHAPQLHILNLKAA